MSKPWGEVGAWARETEREEAEERARADDAAAATNSFSGGEPAQNFPSLKESITKTTKKKKPISVPLSQFNSSSKGLTPDEIVLLPTGPRERTADELGRGFRSYGGGGGSGAPSRRRSEFGADDDARRGGTRSGDPDLPSRADEVDNWATAKKFAPAGDSNRQERYGYGSSSKADEVDNWSSGKKSFAPPPSRNSGFGSGFRDSLVSGADSDRWVRGGEGERRRFNLDLLKRDEGSQSGAAGSRPSPFGAARPREEVLAEKGMDWRKMEMEIEVKKAVRPTSSQSSRPSSAQSSRPGSPISNLSGEGGAAKPRAKVNPFGDAKPREVLLEEKGMDWRKIDLEREHRSVKRSVTDEEKNLKEEIDQLKMELAKETENTVISDSAHISTERERNFHELIRQKEKDLDQLTSEMDEKVRFDQKASIDVRPGSGSGRTAISSERPISDNPRNIEFMERPRSRGRSDLWSRPMDDRRGFLQSRDSGFLASGNSDRSKSRERW